MYFFHLVDFFPALIPTYVNVKFTNNMSGGSVEN